MLTIYTNKAGGNRVQKKLTWWENDSLQWVSKSAKQTRKSAKIASLQITAHVFWGSPNGMTPAVWLTIQNFRISQANGKYPRSENRCENDIFWSEVGSGFGEPGGTPPPRILRIPPPAPVSYEQSNQQCATSGDPFTRARANILPEGGLWFNIPKCARSVCRIDQSLEKLVFISKKVETES